MLEHGKELLKEEKYEEAYKVFKEHYDKFKDIESYYYCATIDFYNFTNKPIEEYYKMFMYIYKKAPKKFMPAYINQLVTCALNANHPDVCYKVLQEAKKNGIINGYLLYMTAQTSWILYKDYDLSMKHCEEALTADDNDETIDGAINELMAIITAVKYGLDKAMEIITNMYIKFNNKDAIDWTELKVYLALNDKEKIKDFINKNLDRDIIVGYINDVVEYYEKHYDIDELIYYIELIRERYVEQYKSREFIENYYCGLLIEKKKFNEVLDIINNVNLEKADKETYLGLMHKKYYIYSEKQMLEEAGKVAETVCEKYPNPEWLFDVVDYKTAIGEYEEALKSNQRIEQMVTEKGVYKQYKDHLTFNYIRYYRYTGQFDKAFNLTKKIKMNNNYYAILRQILSVSPHPNRWYHSYRMFTFLGKNALSYYDSAKMYFHGEYNVKVDIDKAYELINKSIALKKDGCALSLLGNIYLARGEEDKAFEIFSEYVNGEISSSDCICNSVFYCYMLYLKGDKEKCYDLLIRLRSSYKNRLNENFVLLFAKVSIELEKDLEEPLKLANSYIERRYCPNIYLARVILKKQLGIDYLSDEKKFKKSLKYVGKRERDYYLNNPEGIYMNNF